MAVRFTFQTEKLGSQELELKTLTLIYGDSFQKRREILSSIYALFRMLDDIRNGLLSEKLWRMLSFKKEWREKQIIRVALIDVKELTHALKTMYRDYLPYFMHKNLGYMPSVIPDLDLTSDGVQFVEVRIEPGWGYSVRYIKENGKTEDLIGEISEKFELPSFEEVFQENIMWTFICSFFPHDQDKFIRVGTPVYFPVERLCLSEITEPIEIPEECKIGDIIKTIKEQVISQVSPVCGLAEDFIERCVAPVMVSSIFLSPHSSDDLINALLYEGEITFTEDFIPSYVKNGKVMPLWKLRTEARDLAYLFAGMEYRSQLGPIFIEDIDRYKSTDYQMLLKFLLEELLEEGSIFIISAEGEYFPSIVDTYMVENGNGLCRLYSIDIGSQA